jgi:phosphoribosylformylglycinamidine cyclo-ligase
MAHITGGGIPGNLPRILPDNVGAIIKEGSWPCPPVFRVIEESGFVPSLDMRRTFNMGIGYIMVVPKDRAEETVSILQEAGFASYRIGSVVKGGKEILYE